MQNTCYEKLINSIDVKKNTVIFDNHILHARALIKAIDGFARSLTALGFAKGDVLTVYLPTTPQAIVAFYACSKIGVIANFVHPLIPFEQLKTNLIITKSKGLMYYDVLTKNGKTLNSLNQILIKCSIGDFHIWRKLLYKGFVAINYKDEFGRLKFTKLIKTKETAEAAYKPTGEDIVCTMHSGGTSGEPKIVKLSNEAINGVAEALDGFASVEAGKAYSLAALPVFHAYGLGVAIHTALVKRYNVVLMSKFSAKKANRYMRRYRVSMFAGVPVMFKKMEDCQNFNGRYLKYMDLLWCGGDAVSQSFVDKYNFALRSRGSKARLMPGYGLTEVCGVCTANTPENYNKKSCGKPIPGTTVEIWDDDGKALPVNTVGEVAVSSKSVMSGYLEGESGVTEKDGKRWVRTGDIGYLNEQGYLFIVDRKKRSIKINAINIFPAEIEACVRTNDSVEEACATHYCVDNKIYIKLYITIKEPIDNDGKLKKELTELCRQNLIKYAVPREIIILDEMPRTKLGKIDYNKLDII